MKVLLATFLMLLFVMAACDLRSETAKKEMEKFTSSPTPTISPPPAKEPVNPAEVVTVDANLEGDSISIDGYDQKKSVNCTKVNRVRINGDGNKIVVKGACRQIMINGDRNEITAVAAMEFIFNGSENTIRWSHYVNGKEPVITKNRAGNVIEKVPVDAMKSNRNVK